MAENFDVLINLITKSSGDGVTGTTSALADLDAKVKSSKAFLETQTAALIKQKAAAKELTNEYKILAKRYKDYENFSPEAKTRMGEQNPEYRKYLDMQNAVSELNEEIAKQTKVVGDAKAANKEFGRELKRVKEAEDSAGGAAGKTNVLLTAQSTILSRVSSQLTRFGTGAMIGGTAILGGIVAEANRYAKEAGMATEATRKWNAQLITLQAARTKIDRTLVREALPLIETAAKVATVAASFISSHPNIVQAALTVGASLVTIGALSKALAVPIKLLSDRLYYTAQIGQIQALNANTAALLKSSVMEVAGGAKAILATIVPIVVSAVALFLGSQIGSGVGNVAGEKIYGSEWKTQNVGDAIQTAVKTFQIPGLALAAYLQDLGVITDKTGQKIEDFATWIRKIYALISIPTAPPESYSFTTPSGTTDAYPDIKKGSFDFQMNSLAGISNAPQASLWAEQQVLALRVVDASITDLTANYTASLESITADFLKNQKQVEIEYADQRAQIVRDSTVEIRQIEQDHQRRLAKMALAHEDKMYSLNLQRDALGREIELRDYARAQDEEESNTNLEIKRRRADIALKLSDMAKQYRAERALAVQKYQEQLNVEKEKYDAQHSILEAQKRDLLKYLTDKQAYERAYNAAILADLAVYAAAWRAILASALTPTQINLPYSGYPIPDYANHADGGYADYGLHLLGDNPTGGRGPREFVMSGRTTRAAENMLGGALNQQNLIAALSGGDKLHIVDNSRYATNISASDRRALRNGAVSDMLRIATRNKR